MKTLAPLLFLGLAACHKPPHDVVYMASCDKCRVSYIVDGGTVKTETLDTKRWWMNPDSTKVIDILYVSTTVEHGITPTITMAHDSGYALGAVRANNWTQSQRVFGGAVTIVWH